MRSRVLSLTTVRAAKRNPLTLVLGHTVAHADLLKRHVEARRTQRLC
jgi:hypothetical protein